jgi:hypothetical protein
LKKKLLKRKTKRKKLSYQERNKNSSKLPKRTKLIKRKKLNQLVKAR